MLRARSKGLPHYSIDCMLSPLLKQPSTWCALSRLWHTPARSSLHCAAYYQSRVIRSTAPKMDKFLVKKRPAGNVLPDALGKGDAKKVRTVLQSSDGQALASKTTATVTGSTGAESTGAMVPAVTTARTVVTAATPDTDASSRHATAAETDAIASTSGQPGLADLLTETSWKVHLDGEFKKPYFQKLEKFLKTEWASQQIFPPKDAIFRAFNSCSFDDVKVVVLGQDPYHNVNQAMGLSFSVPPGQPGPSSLKNMYRELANDCGCTVPKHGNLIKWAKQGVLMLNVCLTVRAHQANSHSKRGWEQFTDAAISALNHKRRNVVFLLWGKSAELKAKGVDRARHHILTAAHPSGLSANRGFFGCKHFSKTNVFLTQADLPTIDWQIDNEADAAL